jgi:hypothetical protein
MRVKNDAVNKENENRKEEVDVWNQGGSVQRPQAPPRQEWGLRHVY